MASFMTVKELRRQINNSALDDCCVIVPTEFEMIFAKLDGSSVARLDVPAERIVVTTTGYGTNGPTGIAPERLTRPVEDVEAEAASAAAPPIGAKPQ